jgi:hypothetical protein
MALSFVENDVLATVNKEQATLGSNDLEMMNLAHQRTGVIQGCEVTARGDQSVNVAAGNVVIAGTPVSVLQQDDVPIDPADDTYGRFDLISINSSGTAIVTTGTPAAVPSIPNLQANTVPIATLFVEIGDDVHWSYQVNDKRIYIGDIALNHLVDVDAPTPSDNDVLSYESASGHWVPAPAAIGGEFGDVDLDDLNDVDAGTPVDGHVLTFDVASSTWKPAAGTPGPAGSSNNIFWTIAAYNAPQWVKGPGQRRLRLQRRRCADQRCPPQRLRRRTFRRELQDR